MCALLQGTHSLGSSLSPQGRTENLGGLTAIHVPAQQWQIGSPPCLGKDRNRTSSPREPHRVTGHKAQWGRGRSTTDRKKKYNTFHFDRLTGFSIAAMGSVMHMQESLCLCVHDTHMKAESKYTDNTLDTHMEHADECCLI